MRVIGPRGGLAEGARQPPPRLRRRKAWASALLLGRAEVVDFADGGKRRAPPVVADDPSDMDLRGELWRVRACDVTDDAGADRTALRRAEAAAAEAEQQRGNPDRVEAARRGRSSKRRRH